VTATRKPTARSTRRQVADPLADYVQPARWPHPGYDIFRLDPSKNAGRKWLVRCNAHTTFHAEDDLKTADVSGRFAGRQQWCAECAALAAAKAKPAPAKRTRRTPAS
jgi:hypothetical protein